jgi:dynein heavy chain 2
MKSFIEFPGSKFKGFAEDNSGAKIFSAMASKNTDSLTQVYVKAEQLFTKLNALLAKYRPFCLLGAVDLSSYVKANCHETHDYSANFAVLKTKRKDADKLPDTERVDCIRVSMREFNSTVNDQMQRLHDMLLVGLRNNIELSFKDVDEFLASSIATLKETPTTIEEITLAQSNWKEISGKKDEMRELSRKCEEKLDLLLTQATSSNAIDPSDVSAKMANLDNSENSRWYNLEYELEAFSELIEKQKERAVDILEKDVMDMNATIDSFSNRWQSLKPTEMKSWEKNRVEDVFVKLDNFWAEFEDLKAQSSTLASNCVNFSMNLPRFDSLESVETDLTKTTSSWNMLREYAEELDKMATQVSPPVFFSRHHRHHLTELTPPPPPPPPRTGSPSARTSSRWRTSARRGLRS